MAKMKLALLCIVFALVLIIPGSAMWQISDPNYSGYVVFNADDTGYAVIDGYYYQPFTYTTETPYTYTVQTKIFSKIYNFEIVYDPRNQTITSNARPGSKLVWVP